MRVVKQSTSRNVMVYMVDSTDHTTPKTGLTLTVTASKDGAAFASISPTVTERGNGWYSLALTSSHTDTLGDLAIRATGTAADDAAVLLQVVAYDFGDSTSLGLSRLDATVGSRLASASYTSPLDAAGVRSAVGLASANLDTQLSTIDTVVDAILADTGTDGVVVASGSKTGYSLAAAGLDAVTVEAGLNARQALAINAAALAGVLSGAATTSITVKGAGVATTRITATVDADGNRSAVTLAPPA